MPSAAARAPCSLSFESSSIDELLALGTLGLELLAFGRACVARRFELGGLGADRFLHFREVFEIDAELVDAADARALEIAVVGEHARDRGDVVLLQQQLQLFVAAERVCRTQQRGERSALRLQRGFELRARGVELVEIRLLRGELLVERVDILRDLGECDFLRAQRLRRLAALAFGCTLLLGERLYLGAHGVELPARLMLLRGRFRIGPLRIGLVGLRMRERRAEREQDEQRGANDQAESSTRLWPVISGGSGNPISASTVGAISRSDP